MHVNSVQAIVFCSVNMQNLWRFHCRRVVDLKLPKVFYTPTSRRPCWRVKKKTKKTSAVLEYSCGNWRFFWQLVCKSMADGHTKTLWFWFCWVLGITFLRGMGTSSQFLAFFTMAPTLTCRYYAPINVKPQDGGGGGGGGDFDIFWKNASNSPPTWQHNWPEVSKAPTLGRVKVAKIMPFRLCCTQ